MSFAERFRPVKIHLHVLPKLPSVFSTSHDLCITIHSSSEEFWEFSLDVGDESDLFLLVSEESCLLDGFDITNRQTNLRNM